MKKYDIKRLFANNEEDIVDKKDGKDRPVLILVDSDGSPDQTILGVKITGTKRPEYYKIKKWKEAGLNKPSYINFGFKMPYLAKEIERSDTIGHLSEEDINTIKSQQLDTNAYRRQQKKRLVRQNNKQNSSFTQSLADDIEESVEEDRPLRVCRSCLMGIESHEGNQHAKTIYVDEDDEEGSKCDWCEETGFDTLYEI